MTGPPTPRHQAAMVRVLTIAIAVMTLAIVFLLGAIVARLINPSAERSAGGSIDFAAAPELEIGLPPGARIVATHVAADRVTFEIATMDGEAGVYTAPLAGFDAPVRLVFRTLE